MIPDTAALNAARRTAELSALAEHPTVDVVVIGGGITGAGIALDAATRGLRVVCVDKQDLAFGTSRWSSKLVHGGLRYLATGNVGIARRSAIERGILMTRNAPHLVRAMPQLVPLLGSMRRRDRALVRTGFLAGDALQPAGKHTRDGVAPLATGLGRARREVGADRAPRRPRRWPVGLRRATDRRRPPGHGRCPYRGPIRRDDPDLRGGIAGHAATGYG